MNSVSLRAQMQMFFSYTVIAGIATLVDLALLFFFTEFLGVWYIFSATISYSFAIVTNYSLNKIYNFKNSSRQIAKQFSLFILVALVGLVLNLTLVFVMVEFLSIWYMFSRIISAFIVVAWSY